MRHMYEDYDFITKDALQGIEKLAAQLFEKRAGPPGPPSQENEGRNYITIDKDESLSRKTLVI